jgi:hypothetical protein
MPREVWVYEQESGGKKITDSIKPKICQRILDHAQKHYGGKYNRIDVRFHGQFCYIDAYTEPCVPTKFNAKLYGESRQEHIERLRNTPTHLCRLRYLGDEDRWSMAFYTYSHEKYEPCIFEHGSWHGTPEEAFDTSSMYLSG